MEEMKVGDRVYHLAGPRHLGTVTETHIPPFGDATVNWDAHGISPARQDTHPTRNLRSIPIARTHQEHR